MKSMRKLFAGAVAAATMLGGLAVGVSAASAAEEKSCGDTTDICMVGMIPNDLNARKLYAVNLAAYQVTGDSPNEQLGLVTNDKVESYVREAVNEVAEPDAPADADPLEWAVQQGLLDQSPDKPGTGAEHPWTEGTTRQFADALAAKLNKLGEDQLKELNDFISTNYINGATWGKTNASGKGLYMVLDHSQYYGRSGYTQSVPMVVGTPLTLNAGTDKETVVSTGVVNVKQERINPTKKVKHKDANDSTYAKTGVVNTNDVVTYRLSGQVPLNDVSRYVFGDKPGSYNNIDPGTFHVYGTKADGTVVDYGTGANDGSDSSLNADVDYRVYKWNDQDKDAPNKTAGDNILTPDELLELDKGSSDDMSKHWWSTLSGDSKNWWGFAVDLTGLLDQARADGVITFFVTYDATIWNAWEPSKSDVTNEVRLYVGDGSSVAAKTTLRAPVSVEFTKVAASDANTKLAGAEFSIAVGEGQTGTVPAETTATSGTDGKVTFKGLSPGTYTVTETKAPEGYLANALPTFTLTVKDDGTFTMAGTGDYADLVDGKTKQVKNAKSLTELPLTGGVGIAVFGLAAMALLGVAVFGANRYRSNRRSLRA